MRAFIPLALAIAVAAATTAATEMPTVTIDNFSFGPNTLTIRAGAHVTFTNQDDLPHSVVIPDLQRKSPLLDTGNNFEAVFDKPGTYKYFCGIHPKMTGEITVTDK